jgi:hypothetical protein
MESVEAELLFKLKNVQVYFLENGTRQEQVAPEDNPFVLELFRFWVGPDNSDKGTGCFLICFIQHTLSL